MPLFTLKKGFVAVSAPAGGGRIIHLRTGDSLEVPASELLLLARAAAQGVDSGDPELAAVVRKYSDLGMLVPRTAATEPALAPTLVTAATPASTDVLPALDRGLKAVRRAQSSIFDVTNPASGKTFQLYDFELSLARMLDGKRTHAEAVEAAQRLGIPVTLDSLAKFLRQLDRYGFLSAGAADATFSPGESSVWSARTRWDDAVRGLFQSGLQMFRQGRYAEAAGYFDAMLEQDPQNPEALEMRTQVGLKLTGGVAPPPAPLPPSDRPLESFDELRLEDAPGDFELPTVGPVAPLAVQPSPPSVPPVHALPVAATSPTVAPPLEDAPLPPLPASAEVALEAMPTAPPMHRAPLADSPAAAVVPLEARPTAPPAHQPTQAPPPSPASAPSSLRPLLLAGGGVATLLVCIAIAFMLRPEAKPTPPAPTRAPVAIAPVRPVTPPLPPVEPAPVEPAPVEPEPAVDAGVAAAVAPPSGNADWTEFKIVKRGRVKMDAIVAPVAGEVKWKARPEQLVKRGEVVAMVQPAEGDEVKLAAKQEGLVLPSPGIGGTAAANEELAGILYFEAYLLADVTGVTPAPDWRCEVASKSADAHAPCKVVKAVSKGSALQVTATTEPRWFDAATDTVLRLAPP